MNKNQSIKYLKANEIDIQRAHAFLFICDLAYTAYANSENTHGAKFSPVFCYLSYKDHEPHYQFISKNNINGIAFKIWKDYLKNKTSLDKKISIHEKLLNNFDQIWTLFKKKEADKMTRKDFLAFYDKLIYEAKRWWALASIGENKGHIIEEILVPRFAERHNLKLKEAREFMHIFSHPKERSVFNMERGDFFGLVLDAAGKNKNDKNIKRYLKKYFWIKTDFCRTAPVNYETVLGDIAKELKGGNLKSVKSELDKLRNSERKLEIEKNKILKKIKLSSEDLKDLYFAKRMIYWTDRRKGGMLHHMHYLWNFFEVVSKKFNIPYEELSMHTVEEVRNFIRTGKRASKKEIKNRQNGFFINFEKGKKLKLFFGREGKEILREATETKENTVKGMIASWGEDKKIQGKVKIIMNIKRDEFNENEILVTSMTRPEFVPLMRKAKAVITDEGGIACHAAIISRELSLPCIIGTKIATKILRNGWTVEMNMETGEVKIIKK